MASTKEYLTYVLDQLSALGGVTHRAMMGEYVLYYEGKVVGGVYDDRLLLKSLDSAKVILVHEGRDILTDIPYEGAKAMLVADADDAALVCRLVEAIASELPSPKRKG